MEAPSLIKGYGLLVSGKFLAWVGKPEHFLSTKPLNSKSYLLR